MSTSKYQPVTGTQNEKYLFGSGGYAATSRLNLQYYLFQSQAGFQISPLIMLDKDNLHIADIGTGTAIWHVEFSKQVLPSTKIDAFDIATELAPRPEWLPSNVKCHHLNIYDPIPEEFIEKFDIVHLRYFAPAVQKGDPVPIIKQAMKFLKPGGFTEWDERDQMSSRVSPGPSGETKSMERFVGLALNFAKGNSENSAAWVSSLDKAFKTCGLEVLDFSRIPTPKETFGFTQDVILLTAEEASHRMDHVKGYDGLSKGAEMRDGLIEEVYKEHRLHGSVMEADLVVCVGRKPTCG